MTTTQAHIFSLENLRALSRDLQLRIIDSKSAYTKADQLIRDNVAKGTARYGTRKLTLSLADLMLHEAAKRIRASAQHEMQSLVPLYRKVRVLQSQLVANLGVTGVTRWPQSCLQDYLVGHIFHGLHYTPAGYHDWSSNLGHAGKEALKAFVHANPACFPSLTRGPLSTMSEPPAVPAMPPSRAALFAKIKASNVLSAADLYTLAAALLR